MHSSLCECWMSEKNNKFWQKHFEMATLLPKEITVKTSEYFSCWKSSAGGWPRLDRCRKTAVMSTCRWTPWKNIKRPNGPAGKYAIFEMGSGVLTHIWNQKQQEMAKWFSLPGLKASYWWCLCPPNTHSLKSVFSLIEDFHTSWIFSNMCTVILVLLA